MGVGERESATGGKESVNIMESTQSQRAGGQQVRTQR